jgi:uncharacterized protein VirK/YbjX
MASNSGDDLFFYLSHRHYLARGLSVRARSDSALCHYQHECHAFDPAYLEQVYSQDGLTLWRETVDGVAYDIRLVPGMDVLYEGGLSVVLNVNGGRVCVLSFSWMPRHLLLPAEPVGGSEGTGSATIPFVVRKQLAYNHAYQAEFNKAFSRTMPAHLVFAALAGIALPQGYREVVGIAAERHLAACEQNRPQLQRAYDEFWSSLCGQPFSPFGYLIGLPLQLTSLDDLNASQRKRAKVRRAHIDAVRQSAEETIRPYLRGSSEASSPENRGNELCYTQRERRRSA